MVSVTRRQLLLLLVPVAALLVLAGQRLAPGGGHASTRAGAAAPVASEPAPARERIVVHVSGAVEEPGLYRLPEGTRVADLVRRAGGLKPRADLTALNLAAPLADGEHVVVTRRLSAPGEAGGAGATAAAGPASGAKVQLSTASLEELDALPGIGPVTAQKIVDWRTAHGAFRSVDDLDAIPGIGPARVEQLRDLVIP